MHDRRRKSDVAISGWLLDLIVVCALLGVLSIMVTGLTSCGVLLTRGDVAKTQDVAEGNRQAIKRACEVLNYAIARSTPKRTKGGGPTPTELYIVQIVEGMNAVEKAALRKAIAEYPPLGPADCDAAVSGKGDPFPKPKS